MSKETLREQALEAWLQEPDHVRYGHRQSFRDGFEAAYSQAYLEGQDAAVKELQHGRDQDNRLADLYEQALALLAQLTATRSKEQLLLDDERDAHADTRLELQKANDRLVEHKRMNRTLNEVVQGHEKRITRAVAKLEPMRGDCFVDAALEELR